MNDRRPISALTIAGSDSGGGAGIQADLKTFAAHGVHGLSAITAITAQHTRAVTDIQVLSARVIRAQIAACFEDFRIGVVKLGMLANAETIHAVADALDHHCPAAVVLDPVMVATSGARLLADDALEALRQRLLPLSSIVTPNIPEASWLLGRDIGDAAGADAAVQGLRAMGARAVLLKGGHLDEGAQVVERYDDGVDNACFRHPRLAIEAHGTGCTLASAIAANLCRGHTLQAACEAAGDYVAQALQSGYQPGRSHIVVLDQGAARPGGLSLTHKKAGD